MEPCRGAPPAGRRTRTPAGLHAVPRCIYLAVTIPLIMHLTMGSVKASIAVTRFEDVLVSDTRTLTRANSPYLIEKDVLIDATGVLTVEPGVTIRFAEEVGITVRGVLKAEGGDLPDDQIRFVANEDDHDMVSPNRTIRLVDGPSVNEGIVQLLEGDFWRYVCTNSRNWTQADMEVACRQLGFAGGEWYHWFPHLNETRQMMFQDPGCTGQEASMDRCRWDRRKMGSGVCDHHPNIGLLCLPFHHPENKAAQGHWRGLRFESAPYSKVLTGDSTLYVSVSRSVLRNVEVSGAGRGRYLGRPNVTSAIESWGVPPVMEHILVENSAYNGINITQPDSVVRISHARVINNRGYGIYVNSTKGYVLIEHSFVQNNLADGIKYFQHDQRPETKKVDGVDVHDFCTYSTTYSQTYPFMMVAEQYEDTKVDRACGKRFYTKHGYLLTLHFVHLMSAVNDGAQVEVRDGSDSNARLITVVDIRNYTRPESIVTTGNNMFVVFKAKREVKTELFMEITAGKNTKAYDLNVTDTKVINNGGRGIWVEHMRSCVHVHRSYVARHNHVAGISIQGGSGDVNVTYTRIINNYVDGVNITYGGGNRNLSWSEISNNVGYGVAIWLNETTINTAVRVETTSVAYSNISLNWDVGVLVGNFCGPAIVNISTNHFNDGRYIGLEVLSCWKDTAELELIKKQTSVASSGETHLFIGHNFFRRNRNVATKISPLAKMGGKIEHNDYLENLQGCLYIKNEDDFVLETQMADILIHENRFLRNRGPFVVNLGLSHYNFVKSQKLRMTFNWVQDNVVTEPWAGLNPRSVVAAPVVISSSNVRIDRNLIDNPRSKYELGSHLIEPNSELECTHNWLGHKDEKRVWERVFDRDDRYNLAHIRYKPYLLSNNINTELILERPEWEHLFTDGPSQDDHEGMMEVGGEITGVEELRADGVYHVRRDINVRPGGRLKITPGVTLMFEHSVGMMISGELIAEGDLKGGRPLFTLMKAPSKATSSNGTMTSEDKEDLHRLETSMMPQVVRLVGGQNSLEGRLEVNVGGQWGTVCNFGWTIESAAMACQQMGWVLNPEDWNLTPNEVQQSRAKMTAGSNDLPIVMSNVRCGDLDTDVTRCKLSETRDMFLNSCTHQDDVGLRCYDISWAGIRFGMTAKRSKLYDVKVERAGLYDFRTWQFRPAIQADFSHHVYDHLEVSDNDHDGLGILYSDIYFPDKVNYITDSKFINNRRHGLSFRQLGMNVERCEISGNGGAGIHQDPKLEKLDQRELVEWMSLIEEQKRGTIINIPESQEGQDPDSPIVVPEGESRLIFSRAMNDSSDGGASSRRVYHLRAERDEFVLGLQLLNPFHNHTTESLLIYDYRQIRRDNRMVKVWNVSRDIASFPTISSSYAVTLDFGSGKTGLGNMMLLVTPINCADLPGNCNPEAYYINPIHRSTIVPGSFPRLTIQRSKISHNGQGISTIHYNRYLGDDSQVYLRKANESLEVFDSEISSNAGEAVHVFTPFRELNQFNISEITYMINRTRFYDNGRGIYQYSRDIRDSNNLYKWVLRENTFEGNLAGGFDVTLPYVWQYNENYTHTVHIDSNLMTDNEDFELTISGHFARVYVVNNTILNNRCHYGLLALRGMEKESWVFANVIKNNYGVFMVEIDIDSHSEILGFVDAYFTQNIVQENAWGGGLTQKSNRHHGEKRYDGAEHTSEASYAVGIRGIQKFNITDNLFGNPGMDYELLAGIATARVSNYLNAIQNYWGTSDLSQIRQKIFDFDDWNSHAITYFLPYYQENGFDSSLSSVYEKDPVVDLDNLGGRLHESLHLRVRRPPRPYIVKSDLTVMPGVTLTIDPGVELEFYPSVGILVLGTLDAQGNVDRNIVMRPVRRSRITDYRIGRHQGNYHVKAPNTNLKYETLPSQKSTGRYRRHTRVTEEMDFDVRLCQADVNGTVCPEGANQGFVEIFNRTTMQWVPICDTRFSERNAQVVCRQLGFSDLSVFMDFDRRIEFHAQYLNRIIFWPEPFQCTGRENRLSHCELRMNGQIYGHKYACNWEGTDFVFVHCGDTNNNNNDQDIPGHTRYDGEDGWDYWGGVRFSVKEFEQELFHSRIHDAVTHSNVVRHESILQYVQIVGAGILHGEKSPAVQTVMASPLLSSLNISKSAYDGINMISPLKTMNMLYNKIENNLGVGISAAILTGEVREAELSAFVPLDRVPLPYHVFGLVDMCDPQKEIVVEERVLLYYKYDNNPVDCVKIFSSIYDVKPIGFRLLQFNLVNSTGEPWQPDHITLYDGDLYNRTTRRIVEIKVGDGKQSERFLHKTTKYNAMSVKFHATGAREHLGFVAEVVTLPISAVGLDRDVKHNISFSVLENNHLGAVHYASAGETNPIVTMQRNQVASNCENLYGNFSSCQSAVTFDIQNHQDFFFHNNYLVRNVGGLYVKAGSSGTATALRGILHNNVFDENVEKVTLKLEGRQTTPYQQITMYKNYVTRSDVPHQTVIQMLQVVCNTSYNAIHNNRGKSIMEVTGFDNVRLPIYQSFTHNGFYNNYAYGLHCDQTTFMRCRWGSRATVVAGSAGQEYVDNIFYNMDNDYEMVTLNRSAWDVWKTPINAKYNYWAYNETYAVAGRIKDLHDQDGLLEVDFTPFQMNNRTLMSGKCQPGWTLLEDTCYSYHGGPMTFQQAKEFCRKDNATIPFIKNFYWFTTLMEYLEIEQEDWRYYDMVWVSDLDAKEGQCKVFVDRNVETVSCDFLLPTLCEMDEHPALALDFLKAEFIFAIVAALVGILLILVVCCLWCAKAKHRKRERFERRNSIRLSKSSLGSRSLVSVSSTGFTDINYRRRIMSQNNGSNAGATILSSAASTIAAKDPQLQQVASSSAVTKSSFDSLLAPDRKPSLAMLNTTVEGDEGLQSIKASSGNLLPSTFHHLQQQQHTFAADLHDVHYPGLINSMSGIGPYNPVEVVNGLAYGTGDQAAPTYVSNLGLNAATVHQHPQQHRPYLAQSSLAQGHVAHDIVGLPQVGSSSTNTSFHGHQHQLPEQQQQLKRELRERFGVGGDASSSSSSSAASPAASSPSTRSSASSSSSSAQTTDTEETGGGAGGGDRNGEANNQHDYQTMDTTISRSFYVPGATAVGRSTFRPGPNLPVPGPAAPSPAGGGSNSVQRSLPSIPPSDPGYAKPFGHLMATTVTLSNSNKHPFRDINTPPPPPPPPLPPTESPPSINRPFSARSHQNILETSFDDPPPQNNSRVLLETSLDDYDNYAARTQYDHRLTTTRTASINRGKRSRSVGQMLETNFDDDADNIDNLLPSTSSNTHDDSEITPLRSSNPAHSRSLGYPGVHNLALGLEAPLETEM